MKANLGWLAAVCLMHAEISSWAVFDASETLMFQIYSDIRNSLLSERQKIFKFIFKLLLMSETLVLNSFSCFWRVRNFSNLFSSTCFWRVRNTDVSNLSSSLETVCFWESEIFLNLCSSNCFLRARNFSNLFFRQSVSFKFIFLFQSDGPEIFQISFLQFSATDKLSCFLYLHILCKNMSFQTQILFRYVYEWSEFFSVIVFDPFSYYLNVNLRWASRFFTQLFFRK